MMWPLTFCAIGIVVAVTAGLTAPHKYDTALREWSRAPSRAHKFASFLGCAIAALGAFALALNAFHGGAQ